MRWHVHQTGGDYGEKDLRTPGHCRQVGDSARLLAPQVFPGCQAEAKTAGEQKWIGGAFTARGGSEYPPQGPWHCCECPPSVLALCVPCENSRVMLICTLNA